jgi:hypothetical protein
MANPIELWTIQMGQWRLAKAAGIHLLDSTAKSGVEAFAPLMHNVMAYKSGQLSEEQYTALYLEKMAQSKIINSRTWAFLDHYPKLAIACYCPAGVFCHRHLFKKLAIEHLTNQNITVIDRGELIKQKG